VLHTIDVVSVVAMEVAAGTHVRTRIARIAHSLRVAHGVFLSRHMHQIPILSVFKRLKQIQFPNAQNGPKTLAILEDSSKS